MPISRTRISAPNRRHSAPADSPFFNTGYGDVITIATSVVSSLTFPNYIAAMRRPDIALDPRFATPEARRKNLYALYAIIQQWISFLPHRR